MSEGFVTRRWLPPLCLALLCEVLFVLAVSYLHASINNTLTHNGNWSSTKLGLGLKLVGAYSFANSRQTLSGERLNLGRWYGHQEVVLRRPLEPRKVRFEFLLQDQAYLAFLFGRGETHDHGLLLSLHPRFPNVQYVADRAGEFLSTAPIDPSGLKAGVCSTLEGSFQNGSFEARLDGNLLGSFPCSAPENRIVGFRGSERDVFVDEITVECGPGLEPFHETFFNRTDFLRSAGTLGSVLAALDLLLLLGLSRLQPSRIRRLTLPALTLLLILTIGSGIALLVYQTLLGNGYTVAPAKREAAWREREVESVSRQIRQRERDSRAGEVTRVLFIGSSQTHGVGATREEETLVKVAEDLLNRRAGGQRRYECVNTGISGQTAPRLLELYRSEWAFLLPSLVVINLSVNDQDALAFERSLREFLRLNATLGIQTLFSLEPTSEEVPHMEGRERKVMCEVSKVDSVPLVDTHQILDRYLGTGFLWWDFVHPTSYGHRRIAECLVPEIERLTRR
ncbi:MAG: SGNH/GDSL hydrolase family protein [Planctomycetota bacterium]